MKKNFSELALKMHEENGGKVSIQSKVKVKCKDDLSTAYTPGVAEPCLKIKENKDDVLFKTKGREFTINKNDVSLESFREKSKIIAPMISHKAEKAKDFNEILMKQHEQKKSIKL